MPKHVLISGASIAGPALAYWLHRYGFKVTVVEQAPGLRLGGQNIDVKGPAQEVAKMMVIEAAIREQRKNAKPEKAQRYSLSDLIGVLYPFWHGLG